MPFRWLTCIRDRIRTRQEHSRKTAPVHAAGAGAEAGRSLPAKDGLTVRIGFVVGCELHPWYSVASHLSIGHGSEQTHVDLIRGRADGIRSEGGEIRAAHRVCNRV